MDTDKMDFWATFSQTGKIDDYLRYRGIVLNPTENAVEGREEHGRRKESAPDDRRSDRAGISDDRGSGSVRRDPDEG